MWLRKRGVMHKPVSESKNINKCGECKQIWYTNVKRGYDKVPARERGPKECPNCNPRKTRLNTSLVIKMRGSDVTL